MAGSVVNGCILEDARILRRQPLHEFVIVIAPDLDRAVIRFHVSVCRKRGEGGQQDHCRQHEHEHPKTQREFLSFFANVHEFSFDGFGGAGPDLPFSP